MHAGCRCSASLPVRIPIVDMSGEIRCPLSSVQCFRVDMILSLLILTHEGFSSVRVSSVNKSWIALMEKAHALLSSRCAFSHFAFGCLANSTCVHWIDLQSVSIVVVFVI